MRRLALALLLFGLSLCGLPAGVRALPAAPGASDPMIVIGVVGSLSGPGALAGQDLVDGFNLAMRHLGGRFANQEVRVVVADDKGSPDTALAVTRRLLDKEKVDVVLTATSPAALAAILAPLTEAKVFVLNLDAFPPGLDGAGCSPWVFQIGTPPDGVNEAAGQYLAGERVRRLAVVGPDLPSTNDAVAALKRTFPGEVAAVIKPRHGAATFTGEIDGLRALKPDAVYSLLTGGMGVAFVREFDAAGLKAEIPLVGPWTAFERTVLPAMAESALDVANIAPWNADLDSPQNKRLVVDFESEFGRPATPWSAQGYDAALLLDAALKATAGRTADTDALRAALRRAEFASVRGAFHFNTNQFPVVNLYLRKVTRDAKGRWTQELRGVVLKDWRDRHAGQCPMRWVEDHAAPAPAKPGAQAPKPPATPPPKPPAATAPRTAH